MGFLPAMTPPFGCVPSASSLGDSGVMLLAVEIRFGPVGNARAPMRAGEKQD